MLYRSKRLASPMSLLIVFGLILTACQPAAAPAPATEAPSGPVEIKIAFFSPLTGGAAFLGTEQLAFARLAVEDFNKGMVPYHATLVEEDTDITPDKAVPVAERTAADETILGVVGPAGSGQVEATAEIFETAGLAHVSPSATRPSLATAGNKTFFRVVPNDDVQGPTDANYIADEIGAKNVYVLDDQESYGTNLADTVDKVLKQKGVTTTRASVTQADTDFSSLVTTIKGSGAELVFFAGQIPSQGALLAKQLKEQGVDIPVFGGDGFFSSKEYIDDAGGATEGSYASVFFQDIRGIAEAADVAKAADAAFPTWGNFGPPTYAATIVVLEAAVRAHKAGNLSRAGVLAEVAKTDVKILGVPFKFDQNGEVIGATFYISQVKDSKFVQVFP